MGSTCDTRFACSDKPRSLPHPLAPSHLGEIYQWTIVSGLHYSVDAFGTFKGGHMSIKSVVAGLCCFAGLLLARASIAGECASRPERFELRSDTVYWSFSIQPGGECLQGLRGRTQLLDEIKLLEPPTAGVVTTVGPSFRYQAPSSAGNDRFTLEVTGENRRQRGTSTIIVEVTVR